MSFIAYRIISQGLKYYFFYYLNEDHHRSESEFSYEAFLYFFVDF